jgi:hypothetical protein
LAAGQPRQDFYQIGAYFLQACKRLLGDSLPFERQPKPVLIPPFGTTDMLEDTSDAPALARI